MIGWLLWMIATVCVYCYAFAAKKYQLVAIPDQVRTHTKIVPQGMGGIAVLLVVCLCWAKSIISSWSAAGTLLMVVVGIIDDCICLSVKQRFFFQAIAAGMLLIGLAQDPVFMVAGQVHSLSGWKLLLTWLIIVWWINAFNFMDGSDGLASGQGLCLIIAVLAMHFPITSAMSTAWLWTLVVWIPVCWQNWPAAKQYIGSSGSYGFATWSAVLMLQSSTTPEQPLSILVWWTLLILFMLDPTITLLRRMYQRKKLSEAHREHRFHCYLHAIQQVYSRKQAHLILLVGFYSVEILFLFFLAKCCLVDQIHDWCFFGIAVFIGMVVLYGIKFSPHDLSS